MAVVIHDQGRCDESLELYQKALAGLEKTLGKDHPSTLDIVNSMAAVFANQGRHDEALHLKKKCELRDTVGIRGKDVGGHNFNMLVRSAAECLK
ncbi:hypothetical protein RUND412_002230 [Rhizina undulata]